MQPVHYSSLFVAQLAEEFLGAPVQANEDFRTDAKLFSACKDDVSNLCSDLDPGDSREMECLVSIGYVVAS